MKSAVKALVILLAFLLFSFSLYAQIGVPQPEVRNRIASPLVTALVSGEQVRFTALAMAQRIRVEVFSRSGEVLYDSDFRPGNRLEWSLKDQRGFQLPDGGYGCVVTVEDLYGQVSRRQAPFYVTRGVAAFQESTGKESKEAALPEEQDGLVILGADEQLPFTLVSNDGSEGWIESGSGGISFYAGGLSRQGGKAAHLRVTPEGNVGIGVEQPETKLHVAGLIRASEGFQFSDGTILKMEGGNPVLLTISSPGAAGDGVGAPERVSSTGTVGNSGRKNIRLLAATGGIAPLYATVGTAGKIAKFTSSTDLGDSVMTESGGNIGIGTTNPVNRFMVSDSGRGMEIAPNDGTTHATIFGSYDRNASAYLPFDFAGSTIQFTAGGAARAFIDSGGRVGIGTTTPGYALDVFTGPSLYQRTWSATNSNVGNLIQRNEPAGSNNSLWYQYIPGGSTDLRYYNNGSDRLTIQASGNVGIGTASPASRLTVAGNVEVTGAGNGILFPDGSVLTSNEAARIRAITYLAGCDTCSALTDADDQRTIFINLVGAMTINSVTCFSDAGSPVINLQRDSGTQANILTSDLTCSPTGTTSTSIVGAQSVLNLNNKLDFVIVSAGGVAKRVTVAIKATVN